MRKYSIWLLMLMFLVAGLVSGCAELYATKARRDRKKRYQHVQREIQESDELLSKPVPKKKYHRSSRSTKKVESASEPIALPAEEVSAPEPKPVAKPASKPKPARRVESSFKPTPEDIEQLRRPGFVESHDDTEPEPIPVKRPVIRKRVVAKVDPPKKKGPVYRNMVTEKKTAKPVVAKKPTPAPKAKPASVVVKKPTPKPAPAAPKAKPAPVVVKKPTPKPAPVPKAKPAPVVVKKPAPKPAPAPKVKPAPVVVKKPAPKPTPALKPKPKKQKLSRNTIGLTDPINIPRAKNAPEITPPADLMGPIELTRKKRRSRPRRNLTPKVAKIPDNSMDKKADEELKRMAANIGKKAKPKAAAPSAEEVVEIEVAQAPVPVAVVKKPESKPVKKAPEIEVKEVPASTVVAKAPAPKPVVKPVVKKSESLGLPFDEPAKAPAKATVVEPAPIVEVKKSEPKPVKVPPLIVTKKSEPKPVKKIGKAGPVKIPALVVAKKSELKPAKKVAKVEPRKTPAPVVVAKAPTLKPAAKPVVKKSKSLGLPFDEPTKAPAKVVVSKPAPVVVAKKPTPKPAKKVVKVEPKKAPAPVVVAKKPAPRPAKKVVKVEPKKAPAPVVVAKKPAPKPVKKVAKAKPTKANEKWEIEIVEDDSEIEVASAPKPKVAKKNIDWSLPKSKKPAPAKPVKAPVYKERKAPPAAPVVQVKLAKRYTKEELAKAAAVPAKPAASVKLPESKVAPKPITLAKKKDVEVAIAKPVKRPVPVKTAKPKPAPTPKVVEPVADKAVQQKVLKKNDDFMTTSVKGKSKVYLGWPADGMVLRSGMDRLLSWMPASAAKCTDIKLMFSSDNGKTWKSVSRGLKYGKVISWTVPKVNSNKCLLRFVGKDATGQQILATSGLFAVDSGVWSSVEDI